MTRPLFEDDERLTNSYFTGATRSEREVIAGSPRLRQTNLLRYTATVEEQYARLYKENGWAPDRIDSSSVRSSRPKLLDDVEQLDAPELESAPDNEGFVALRETVVTKGHPHCYYARRGRTNVAYSVCQTGWAIGGRLGNYSAPQTVKRPKREGKPAKVYAQPGKRKPKLEALSQEMARKACAKLSKNDWGGAYLDPVPFYGLAYEVVLRTKRRKTETPFVVRAYFRAWKAISNEVKKERQHKTNEVLIAPAEMPEHSEGSQPFADSAEYEEGRSTWRDKYPAAVEALRTMPRVEREALEWRHGSMCPDSCKRHSIDTPEGLAELATHHHHVRWRIVAKGIGTSERGAKRLVRNAEGRFDGCELPLAEDYPIADTWEVRMRFELLYWDNEYRRINDLARRYKWRDSWGMRLTVS